MMLILMKLTIIHVRFMAGHNEFKQLKALNEDINKE